MNKFKVYERKLNPEWKKYNDFYNEGGEGYNPHQKMICNTNYVDKKNILNKMYTYDEAMQMLKKLEESLPKHTDPEKIKTCKNFIQIFTQVLA